MPKERHKFLSCDIFFLLTAIFAATIHNVCSDDADVMAKLARSLTPSPSGWTGSNYCKWPGVSCDSSNKVSSINLSSKSLSGTLPPEINQLSSLKFLSLQRNHLSGPLPALSNLGSLEEVNLDENSFNSIPTGFLSGLTSLQSFSINNNSNLPPWTMPDTLKDSSSLTSFLASKANIIGEIPDIFGSLPNFQSLRLSYNNMTGSLPASFAKSGIQNLWLNNQMMGFSGMIDVLGTMANLKEVWLQSNQFSGQIPDLSACTELTDLQLRDNLLTGVIPDSLTKLPKLQNVALQSNRFQGPMPSFPPGVQVNLGTENHFCLPTPGPCDPQVTALLEAAGAMNYPMDLAESESLTSLKQLQILDLSNNNISGKIPKFPSYVTVKVSGNAFIGKDVPFSVPGGHFSSNNGANDETKPSVLPWLIIVPVLVFVLVIAVLGFVIYRRTKVDVYAFGVVLMEIITGRKSLDSSLPDERSHLVTWFRPLLQDEDNIKDAVDPTLRSVVDEETFQSIWKVAELAGHCTTRESSQRPDMSHAVNVLSSLVEQWKPAPSEEDSFSVDFNMSLPQVLSNIHY